MFFRRGAVFTFEGSGPALTAHGSVDLKQDIHIQIQTRLRGRLVHSLSMNWKQNADVVFLF
jgi:hypothetical protein